MNTKPETPPAGFDSVEQFEAGLASLIAQEANPIGHPQGRLILGMQAARDLLLAEAEVNDTASGSPVDILFCRARRDSYVLAARLLDRKIANLKEGT